ncbi:MAG: hypothetical protein ACOY82_17070 [Pseudomonadota bacterium]
MPTLNEYLGGIFHSIATARVMADMQTVDIAEQYARHDLLRHFAVPRMRIGDVQLTIPVAIDRLSASTTLELTPIGNAGFKSLMYREMVAGLGLQSLPTEASQALYSALDQRTLELAQRIGIEGREAAIQAFSKFSIEDLSRIVAERGVPLPDGSTGIVDYGRIHERILKLCFEVVQGTIEKQNIDQLEVVAESHLLRNQRPEDLIQIRLVVGEDGMEWQTIEKSDGSVERKLIPE